MTSNPDTPNTPPAAKRQLHASLIALQHGLVLLDSSLSEDNPDFESVGMAMEVVAEAIEQKLSAESDEEEEEAGGSLDEVLARIGQPDDVVDAAAVLAEWVAAFKYGESIRYWEAERARAAVYRAVEDLAAEWEENSRA